MIPKVDAFILCGYIYKIIVLCEVFVNVWLLYVSIYPLRGDICHRKATLDLILVSRCFSMGKMGFERETVIFGKYLIFSTYFSV